MTTRATRTRKPAAKKEPEPEPSPIPAESPEPEVAWATKGTLPTRSYTDQVLPVLGTKVRIRFLSNVEATELVLLPDLATFADLMAKAQGNDENEALTLEDRRKLRQERTRYIIHVAHLAVVDRDEPFQVRKCSDQKCGVSEHYPSLWTVDQVGFLMPQDAEFIAATAERAWELERVAPLSRGPTGSPSSRPAGTGG
jgi:hypothetical protein